MMKITLFKIHHSLTMLTLKRLLLTASMGCLVATANAAPVYTVDDYVEALRRFNPMDDWSSAYKRGDYALALKILKPLAAQGNAEAQTQIGYMYDKGEGVTQDYTEALKWWFLAAAQGYAMAQSNLAYMYFTGRGVTKDYIRAHMWYNLSSLSGHPNGTKNSRSVAKLMTPQQIEKAQIMAGQCWAQKFTGC